MMAGGFGYQLVWVGMVHIAKDVRVACVYGIVDDSARWRTGRGTACSVSADHSFKRQRISTQARL